MKIIGTKCAEIKQIFSDIDEDFIKDLSDREKTDLIMKLTLDEYEEMKYFGTLCIIKYPKSIKDEDYDLLTSIIWWFKYLNIDTIDTGIYWWCSADRLAGALTKRISIYPSTVDWFLKWSKSDKLWTQRVSCVGLVPIAKYGKYNDIIIKICSKYKWIYYLYLIVL